MTRRYDEICVAREGREYQCEWNERWKVWICPACDGGLVDPKTGCARCGAVVTSVTRYMRQGAS